MRRRRYGPGDHHRARLSGETAAFWDAHYGRKDQVWSGNPNAVLVDEVQDLPSGAALDLGCGEGADAIWLAQRGWRVTAVDVSETALARAAAAAEQSGVGERVDWQRHDLAVSFPEGAFDLVSAQFFQSPLDLPVARVLRQAAGAVVSGGTILVVSHAAPPPWSSHAHHSPDAFLEPAALAADAGLDGPGWELEVCERRQRMATGPDGHTGPLDDSVIRARRR